MELLTQTDVGFPSLIRHMFYRWEAGDGDYLTVRGNDLGKSTKHFYIDIFQDNVYSEHIKIDVLCDITYLWQPLEQPLYFPLHQRW